MKVKRYGIHFNYGDPVMVERPDGEFYSRADLIAAGCLVPVPDGEACDMDELDCNHWLLLANQRVYYREYDCDTFTTFDDRPDFIALDDAVRVQPVRLVRLEDAG